MLVHALFCQISIFHLKRTPAFIKKGMHKSIPFKELPPQVREILNCLYTGYNLSGITPADAGNTV